MRILRIVALCAVISAVLSAGQSAGVSENSIPGTYTTVWVPGTAGIEIDGDLSDWTAIGVTSAAIEYVTTNIVSSDGRTSGQTSAYVQCFADSDYVYVGVTVRDDHPVFGRQGFGRAWRDDAVGISFYGGISLRHLVDQKYQGSDGQIIVSADQRGGTLIEGGVPMNDRTVSPGLLQFPRLWRALGAKAALRRQSGGYTVEVGIPVEIMQWVPGMRPDYLKMNVRVFDSDGGPSFARSVSWSNDPYNTSSRSNEFYKKIRFTDVAGPGQPRLLEPPTANRRNTVLAALGNTARGDTLRAVSSLEALPREPWMLPILAGVRQAGGDWDASVPILNEIIEREGAQSVLIWARERLATAYRRMGDVGAAVAQYERLASMDSPDAHEVGVSGLAECESSLHGDLAAVQVYRAFLVKSGGFNGRLTSELGQLLARIGKYEEAVAAYRQVVDAAGTTAGEQSHALLRIQQLQDEGKAPGDAVETAWRIQRISSDSDPSRQASVRLLVSTVNRRSGAAKTKGTGPSSTLQQVLSEKRTPFPARQLLDLGNLFAAEGRLDDAVAAFNKVLTIEQAPQSDRGIALLRMQETLAAQGKGDLSIEAGLRLQTSFDDQMETRLRSLNLLKGSCKLMRAGEARSSATRAYEDAAKRFANDLRRWMKSGDSSSQQPYFLLKLFTVADPDIAATAEQDMLLR
ncbi:MAG: tetratricopeptide repeat protein [Acidobacteriales bacterium]|nr:tetratricopeptide repeat protein [Terriglobales bacterium]